MEYLRRLSGQAALRVEAIGLTTGCRNLEAVAQAARVARERRLHQVLEAAALGKQAGRTVAQNRQGFVEMGHGGSGGGRRPAAGSG